MRTANFYSEASRCTTSIAFYEISTHALDNALTAVIFVYMNTAARRVEVEVSDVSEDSADVVYAMGDVDVCVTYALRYIVVVHPEFDGIDVELEQFSYDIKNMWVVSRESGEEIHVANSGLSEHFACILFEQYALEEVEDQIKAGVPISGVHCRAQSRAYAASYGW